jgi:hypothetical protein
MSRAPRSAPRLRRSSERQIIAVDFEPAGGAMGKSEVTEDLILDPFEDP